MDRPIERKNWTPRKMALAGSAIAAIAILLYVGAATTGKTRLNVDSDRIGISQVVQGEFYEYVPINGTVQPNTTVYLDLEEGGIVERIYVQGGSPVKKGDLILSFSNSSAQKQNIEAETRLIDNLNQLRNSKITLTESNLILKDQLLDLEFKLGELQRTFARFQQLMNTPSAQLSKEQFEATRDQITYLRSKRELLVERIRRESELQEQQSAQVDSSIRRVNRNLEILGRIIESLEVRAPIDGYLSTLNVEVGQSFQRGQRVGQIDQLQSFKVRANIDQYYIAKVVPGLIGSFIFDGSAYQLEIAKIYPEVTQDAFQADLIFTTSVPSGLKRGQTLQIDLALSKSSKSNMVEKGPFLRHTSGRWAYLVANDGRSARRVEITLGRQNPQYVEVLQGLRAGDWIITSDYDRFADADELKFPTSLLSEVEAKK